MIPGANLLKTALSVIASQSVEYYAFTTRALNSIGNYVPVYADPIILRGSFQPVARNLYQAYGLDFQKTYYTFYSSVDVLDIIRDTSSDKLGFNGEIYQVESSNDWFAVDGWTGVLAVRIPNAG